MKKSKYANKLNSEGLLRDVVFYITVRVIVFGTSIGLLISSLVNHSIISALVGICLLIFLIIDYNQE